MAVIEDYWFQAMQDEIHEFDRLEVWELVPRPIYVMVIALKWIYKVKLDEYGDVLKNKARTKNSMAEQNVPAQPPTRTDEQIVPRSQWLTIGKSNLSVDILKNTNFFQALTASANVPAIYLQQFWKTMSYNEKTGFIAINLMKNCKT
ncbi:hypothetical protein Tco_1180976 [Tanacetum coccineum]